MSVPVQESLLDLDDTPTPGPLRPERTRLAHGAWIDVQRGWLTGASELFARLAEQVPWRAERRRMYDRTIDVPRLLCFYQEGADLPDPVLAACRDMLSGHYQAELGEPFVTAGLCLYRDGRDSVAWHGDTIGRGSTEDTMVAILSLGEARSLMLRPRPGGGGSIKDKTGGSDGGGKAGTLRYNLGHGDLIVMGGSCQRTWEHAVPKSARPTGPRISVQFRPRGVRLCDPSCPRSGRAHEPVVMHCHVVVRLRTVRSPGHLPHLPSGRRRLAVRSHIDHTGMRHLKEEAPRFQRVPEHRCDVLPHAFVSAAIKVRRTLTRPSRIVRMLIP
jgi:alkylated DNA repair dioxygenase AlkB